MNTDFFQEPELEFGTSRHIDIRFGLMNYGPLDFASPLAPKQIKLGIVGTPETVEGVEAWFEKCKQEIPPKVSKQPNLFAKFPGFGLDQCFHSTITMDSRLKRTIPQRDFDQLAHNLNPDEVVEKAVQMFLQEFGYLVQNANPDVLICAIPISLIRLLLFPETAYSGDEGDSTTETTGIKLDFHDLLKAKAMPLKKPLQLILPTTYDSTKQFFQKRKPGVIRRIQDEATRAWNIHTALYYKARGTPWRLVRDTSELTTCYVGISFYRSLNAERVSTSMAEIFNERGLGTVVRGGAAELSTKDKQPHLSESNAYKLLDFALERYREEHHNLPARLVVHKTSKFNDAELRGFNGSIKDKTIDSADFVSLNKSFTRLFRLSPYPPLRGTFLSLDAKSHILYTRGSVDFFATYPGMYIPRPLVFYCDQVEQTPKFIAREILALTKMNWNNTQFDNSFPITIEASRRVSRILKYLSDTDQVEPRYSYYM